MEIEQALASLGSSLIMGLEVRIDFNCHYCGWSERGVDVGQGVPEDWHIIKEDDDLYESNVVACRECFLKEYNFIHF